MKARDYLQMKLKTRSDLSTPTLLWAYLRGRVKDEYPDFIWYDDEGLGIKFLDIMTEEEDKRIGKMVCVFCGIPQLN